MAEQKKAKTVFVQVMERPTKESIVEKRYQGRGIFWIL